MTPQKRVRGIAYIVLLAVFLGYFIVSANNTFGGQKVKTIATNEFVTAVKEDRVTKVTYKIEDSSLEGEFYESSGDKQEKKISKFRSAYVGTDNLDELMAHHADIEF